MIGAWLLADGAVAELEAAYRLQPTAEQLTAFAARPTSPLTRADGTATISIHGVLTERPNPFAALFGGGNTAYSAIREALAQADADADVREIVLDVASPGGSVDGLFPTLDAIGATRKPIRVRASLAASAAYAIAAAAGTIEALGPAATFGSIGVATSVRVSRDVVDIASTDAPNKRPDVTTEEGKAAVRSELDQLHELFADAIARGRKTTVARVNSDFGRGGTLLAAAAKARGMIDSMTTTTNRSASAATAELATPGSQLAAAQRLAAQLGSASARGEGESQADFAKRLLAAVEPPKPKKVKRSNAELVADIVCGRRETETETESPGTPEAMAVADLVYAAMKKERGNL